MGTKRAVIGMVLLALAAGLWADEGKELYDLRYGERREKVDATASKADDVALAAEHLKDITKYAEYKVLVKVLLEQAYELAMRDKRGYATAAEAVDLLREKFPTDRAAYAGRALKVHELRYRLGEREGAGEKLVGLYLDAAGALAGQKKFEAAFKQALKAYNLAASVKSPRKAAALAARRYYQVRRDLKKTPGDTALRAKAVRMCVAELDDPPGAAKLLDMTSDPAFQAHVPLAAKAPAEAPAADCLKLGKWYLDLSKTASPSGKGVCLGRARTYLQRYLALHVAKDAARLEGELLLDKARKGLASAGVVVATPKAPPGKPKIPSSLTPGKFLDLLKVVSPARHGVLGKWKLEAGRLTAEKWTGGKKPGKVRLMLPAAPNGSYDLQVELARRDTKNPVGIVLPVGRSGVLLMLGVNPPAPAGTDKLYGLTDINGIGLAKNESAVQKPDLLGDTKHTVDVKVRIEGVDAEISVHLDDESLVRWSGSQTSLSVPKGAALHDARCLGLTADSPTTFYCARLSMSSGVAKIFSGEEALGGAYNLAGRRVDKPGEWTDLMKLVSPAKHAVKGKWKLSKGRLSVALNPGHKNVPGRNRILIPVRPRGSYELKVKLARLRGDLPLALVFPVGQASVALVLGAEKGEAHGLSKVAGKGPTNNPTAVRPGRLPTGWVFGVAVKVEVVDNKAAISVDVDGRRVIQWEGDPSSLTLEADKRLPQAGCFGLASGGPASFAAWLRMMGADEVAKLEPEPKTEQGKYYKKLVDAYMDGDWAEVNKQVRLYPKYVSRLSLQQRKDVTYIRQTAPLHQPSWWKHCKSNGNVTFDAKIWNRSFKANYIPSAALGAQGISEVRDGKLVIFVTWQPQLVDNPEAMEDPLSKAHKLTKAHIAECIVWHELGHNYITEFLPADQVLKLYENYTMLFHQLQEFYADMTALYHAGPKGRRCQLFIRMIGLAMNLENDPHMRAAYGIGSIFLAEWLADPENIDKKWPHVHLPGKVPTKDIERNVLAYIYNKFDPRWSLAEDRQMREIVHKTLLTRKSGQRWAEGERILRTKGTIELANKLQYRMMPADDRPHKAKRDAWVKQQLQKAIKARKADKPVKEESDPFGRRDFRMILP